MQEESRLCTKKLLYLGNNFCFATVIFTLLSPMNWLREASICFVSCRIKKCLLISISTGLILVDVMG